MVKDLLKHISMACAALTTVAACVSCGRTNAGSYAAGSVQIACDATFQNIMEQEIFVFESRYKNSSILALYVDEYAAIDSLMNKDNRVYMAVTTRPLNSQEISELGRQKRTVSQQAIAVDAVALIVNPANPITALDYQDVADILSGKYTKWSDIPGAGDLGDIQVVFDHSGSSTTRFMTDSVLNGKPFGQNVYAQKSPAEVFEAVAHRKNAIGIIGAGWLSSDMSGRELSDEEIARLENDADTTSIASFSTDIKVLKVAPKDSPIAYYPDQYNIYNGKYPFHHQIYLISTASPSTVGHSFYSFVTSSVGQKIILTSGVCPKVITPQFVDVVKPE